MDDDGFRNWGYYEPSLKGHLGLQLMSTVTDRNAKPFLSGREHSVMVGNHGGFHTRDCVVSDAPVAPMDYIRDSWVHPREKFLNMVPGHHNYPVLPESSGAHHFQMLQQTEVPRDDRMIRMEGSSAKKEGGPPKKRTGGNAPKAPKTKRVKKTPKMPKENGGAAGQRVRQAKKNVDIVVNGMNMDLSSLPIPVCSCTGTPQQCYRWGCGGWQSACCTTGISMYPLPMSTKRRGARIAGRKMSLGAFKKVLDKLAAEGYSFSNPIDLRNHWAKHGTNKFVTIR